MSSWTSWSGLESAHPVEVRRPVDADDVVTAVRDARERGLGVKMPGTGHSFTGIAVADGVLLRPEGLSGVVALDRAAGTVTVRAGTTLRELNETLVGLDLALHNMGDVQEQTVAGAISTGTHGTGGRVASLSAQVRAIELVDGTGTLRRLAPDADPDLFGPARTGLGALGVITSVTFAVEELTTMSAREWPARWDEVLDCFDELVAAHDHVEAYWWPHTDRLLVKADDRVAGPPRPLSRPRAWLEDELLANTVFGGVQRLGNAVPRLVPALNRVCGAALSERTYSDVPHRVFTSVRRVRFREMEHAVPRAAGLDALRGLRRLVERSDRRIGFPVEVRVAPADDVALSTAYGRDVVHLAVHVDARTDHTAYFREVEALMRDHEGLPHWGKLHARTAADLAPEYARWEDFQAARERLDPDRLFSNAYLERVLGP